MTDAKKAPTKAPSSLLPYTQDSAIVEQNSQVLNLTEQVINFSVAPHFSKPSKSLRGTLSDIANGINAKKPLTDKKSGEIFHFALFENGIEKRTLDACHGSTAMVLDYDGRNGDTVQRETAIALCTKAGYASLAWNTFSSDDSGTTFRLVVPFDKPIQASEYKSLCETVCMGMGLTPPLSLHPASQGYFVNPRVGGQPVNAQYVAGNSIAVNHYKLPDVTPKPKSSDNLDRFISEAKALNLRNHLKLISADDRDTWIRVAGALGPSGGTQPEKSVAFDIFQEWCKSSTKYYLDSKKRKLTEAKAEAQCLKKFNEFASGTNHFNDVFNIKPKAEIDVVKKPVPNGFTLHDYFKIHTLSNEAADKMSDTKFIYTNLIPQGLITAYPSPANGGKTAIFTEAACKMADDGYNVLYINADASPSQLKAQQVKADKHGFKILAPDATDGGGVSGLMKALVELSELDVDLSDVVIIVDTLKKFTDMLSKAELKSFINLLRKLQAKGVTTCLLCHTNKYPTLNGDLIYEGTSDLRNDIDNLVYLYSSLVEKGVREVTSAPDKTRAVFEPISFRIRFGDFGVDVEELDEVLPCFTDESREVFNACVNAINEGVRGGEELVQYVKEALMVGDNKAREKIKAVVDMKHSLLIRRRNEGGKGFTFTIKGDAKTDFADF